MGRKLQNNHFTKQIPWFAFSQKKGHTSGSNIAKNSFWWKHFCVMITRSTMKEKGPRNYFVINSARMVFREADPPYFTYISTYFVRKKTPWMGHLREFVCRIAVLSAPPRFAILAALYRSAQGPGPASAPTECFLSAFVHLARSAQRVFFGTFGAQDASKSAKEHSKSTFWPVPLGTPVNGGWDRKPRLQTGLLYHFSK